MLEGTKNERAAIVATSYLIGFVTAFIGFGVSQISDTKLSVSTFTPQVAQPAAVASALDSKPVLAETSAGLTLSTSNDSILLSALRSPELSAVDVVDGLYSSLAHYELSPNANFVYFCEVPITGMDDCKPFVYSLASDIVVPLKQSGARVALTSTQQDVAWNNDGVVAVSGFSIDPQSF